MSWFLHFLLIVPLSFLSLHDFLPKPSLTQYSIKGSSFLILLQGMDVRLEKWSFRQLRGRLSVTTLKVCNAFYWAISYIICHYVGFAQTVHNVISSLLVRLHCKAVCVIVPKETKRCVFQSISCWLFPCIGSKIR